MMAETEFTGSIGMQMDAPYAVYVDGETIATHATQDEAFKHVARLRNSLLSPRQRQRNRDDLRHALQAPIASPRYRVLYLREGREHCSAWLYQQEHAQRGLKMMQRKYGERNAIIYVD
jgi:hypothetical protein